jgi:hypothetical protein
VGTIPNKSWQSLDLEIPTLTTQSQTQEFGKWAHRGIGKGEGFIV